ncbi:MAG: TolC family protein [Tannerella sp.]|nr:TolC family protein [Tannerella sp.]
MIIGLLAVLLPAWGQNLQEASPLPYRSYMKGVLTGNKAYAAQQLNVSLAEAEIASAKVFNNPELSVAYAYNDDRRLKMGQSATLGLSKEFKPGRRGAALRLASSRKAVEEALLEDHFQQLRAESTLAYLKALEASALWRLRESMYRQISRLATADSLRCLKGELSAVEAARSKIVAEQARNALRQAESELFNACAALNLWMGVDEKAGHFLPQGSLETATRNFDEAALLDAAVERRADLCAALKDVDVARKAQDLARKERNMPFSLSLEYNYNTRVRNEIAPAPAYNGLTLGVSVPLPFSNRNKGALQAAALRLRQAEYNYEQACLEVRSSVVQSLRSYRSLEAQTQSYDQGLLRNAQTLLDGNLRRYEKGEVSLLDVMDAKRAYDEVYTSYVQTSYQRLAALVLLERNAGFWDIDLPESPKK